MKSHVRTLAPVLASLFFVTAGAPRLHAQIVNDIRARVDHNFVVGNTTLPPGEYTFRMRQSDPDLTVMTATGENDKTCVEFIVRETIDDHTPRHSKLVFRKYEKSEFLSKVFGGDQRAA